jgi:hypothetical protein
MRLENYWWQLPGPATFLNAIIEDLRAGRNVVIAMPKHYPPGLCQALSDGLRRMDLYYFRELSLREDPAFNGQLPERILHDRFAPLTDALAVPSAETLACAAPLRETALWIEGFDSAAWPMWREFLDRYKDACRGQTSYERLLLVVLVAGEVADYLPVSDVTLSERRWHGVVRRLDMLLYASRLMEAAGYNGLFRELATAIITEIAGTDPLMADFLATEPLERLLNPLPALRDIARTRGWPHKGSGPGEQLSWSLGITDCRDGKPLSHSAAETAKGKSETISRRVWRAEVGVLFPFLEDYRMELIHQFGYCLRLPVITDYESINEPEGLELSHLCDQLCRQLSASQAELLRCCRRIRNDLAHLHPVDPADLLSTAFVQLAGE